MPSISNSLIKSPASVEPASGVGVASPAAPAAAPSLVSPAPVLSPSLRSPLPNLGPSSTPDNLRQYYVGGLVPQYRLNPVAPLVSASSGSSGVAGAAGPAGAAGSPGPEGPTGPAGGVIQLLEGANITLSPPDGLGTVTISASGGGGGNPEDFSQIFQLMGA